MDIPPISRRSFLKVTGTAALVYTQLPSRLKAGDNPSSSDAEVDDYPSFSISVVRPEDLLVLRFEGYGLELRNGTLIGKQEEETKRKFLAVIFPPQSFAEMFFDERQATLTSPDGETKQVIRPLNRSLTPDTDHDPKAFPSTAESLPVRLPVPAFISGESRLVFDVTDAANQGIAFTLDRLLELCSQSNLVMPKCMSANLGPGAEGQPTAATPSETQIEFPFRLMLSPYGNARWTHRTTPPLGNGETIAELWSTALQSATMPPLRPTLQTPTVALLPNSVDPAATPRERQEPGHLMAFYSPDFVPGLSGWTKNFQQYSPNSWWPASLRDAYRHLLVRQMMVKGWGDITANQLFLTALGSTVDAIYQFNFDDDNAAYLDEKILIEQWLHRTALGRDYYVKAALKGYLLPYQHNATFVELTERKLVETEATPDEKWLLPPGTRPQLKDAETGGAVVGNRVPGAYLLHRRFIVIKDPMREYHPSEEVAGDVDRAQLGRGMVHKSARITETQTPDLAEPDPLPGADGALVFWPREINAPGRPMHLFPLELSDGVQPNPAKPNVPLLFTTNLSVGARLYPLQDKSLRTIPLAGQKLTFAPSQSGGQATAALFPLKSLAALAAGDALTKQDKTDQLVSLISASGQLPGPLPIQLPDYLKQELVSRKVVFAKLLTPGQPNDDDLQAVRTIQGKLVTFVNDGLAGINANIDRTLAKHRAQLEDALTKDAAWANTLRGKASDVAAAAMDWIKGFGLGDAETVARKAELESVLNKISPLSTEDLAARWRAMFVDMKENGKWLDPKSAGLLPDGFVTVQNAQDLAAQFHAAVDGFNEKPELLTINLLQRVIATFPDTARQHLNDAGAWARGEMQNETVAGVLTHAVQTLLSTTQEDKATAGDAEKLVLGILPTGAADVFEKTKGELKRLANRIAPLQAKYQESQLASDRDQWQAAVTSLQEMASLRLQGLTAFFCEWAEKFNDTGQLRNQAQAFIDQLTGASAPLLKNLAKLRGNQADAVLAELTAKVQPFSNQIPALRTNSQQRAAALSAFFCERSRAFLLGASAAASNSFQDRVASLTMMLKALNVEDWAPDLNAMVGSVLTPDSSFVKAADGFRTVAKQWQAAASLWTGPGDFSSRLRTVVGPMIDAEFPSLHPLNQRWQLLKGQLDKFDAYVQAAPAALAQANQLRQQADTLQDPDKTKLQNTANEISALASQFSDRAKQIQDNARQQWALLTTSLQEEFCHLSMQVEDGKAKVARCLNSLRKSVATITGQLRAEEKDAAAAMNQLLSATDQAKAGIANWKNLPTVAEDKIRTVQADLQKRLGDLAAAASAKLEDAAKRAQVFETARRCVDFLLPPDGQQIWTLLRAASSGGDALAFVGQFSGELENALAGSKQIAVDLVTPLRTLINKLPQGLKQGPAILNSLQAASTALNNSLAATGADAQKAFHDLRQNLDHGLTALANEGKQEVWSLCDSLVQAFRPERDAVLANIDSLRATALSTEKEAAAWVQSALTPLASMLNPNRAAEPSREYARVQRLALQQSLDQLVPDTLSKIRDNVGTTALEATSIIMGNQVDFLGTGLNTGERFYPRMDSALVQLPGVAAGAGTAISLAQDYLQGGFDRLQRRATDKITGAANGVFAKILGDATAGGLGGEVQAGVVNPVMQVVGLSRELGSIVGQLPKNAADLEKAAEGAISDLVSGELKQFGSGSVKDTFRKFLPNAKLLGAIDLADVLGALIDVSEVPEILNTKLPDRVEQSWNWSKELDDFGLPPLVAFHPQADYNAGGGKPKLTLGFRGVARIQDGHPNFQSQLKGHLDGFDLTIFQMVKVRFREVNLISSSGEKAKFEPALMGDKNGPVEFIGPLNFVGELQKSFSNLMGDALALETTAQGIEAAIRIALPTIGLGAVTIMNVRLVSGIELPLTDNPLTFRFSFCERSCPFTASVSGFAGGGFFGVILDTRGHKAIEGALEFGAAAALDFFVAHGSVYIMGGFYFRASSDADGGAVISAYVRAGGALSVLGLIVVTVEFYLGLYYQNMPQNSLYGICTISVEVKVLFFSKSVSLTMEKTFAGQSPNKTASLRNRHRGRTIAELASTTLRGLDLASAPPPTTNDATNGTAGDFRGTDDLCFKDRMSAEDVQTYWAAFSEDGIN